MIAVNKWISEKKKEKTHKAWKKSKGVLHKLPTSWVILLSLPVCIMHLKNNGRKIFLMQYGLKFLQLTVHSYIESISQNTYICFIRYLQHCKTMFIYRQILHSVFHPGEAVLGDKGGENPVNLLCLTKSKCWI